CLWGFSPRESWKEVALCVLSAIEGKLRLIGEYEGGSKTSRSDLPENVQNSFNRYEEADWQGNVSGQTLGTNAGRR
ncbi:MAG: hypothetical protein NC489_43290, partial [Ruminococcus flavefaciens]|nr:hypothetical protein [Ruminococcus flavefaciens]